MTTAVALFGSYSLLPAAIRDHGRQPGFAGGHCIYVQPLGGYVPPFLGEFDHETSVVADCVPASGVRGVNYLTRGAQAPCTYTEREDLQTVMGTQGEGADEAQLAAGILARYGHALAHGEAWGPVVSSLGGLAAPVLIGDPLADSDYLGAHVADLEAFAGGLENRFVLFPQPAPLTYTALVGPGNVELFDIPGGTLTPSSSRVVGFDRPGGSPALVRHGAPGHWRIETGYLAGWYLIAGRSSPFRVIRSDGVAVWPGS